MENIERELKCQLHKEGFEELKDYFDREFVSIGKSIHRNYYIDTDSLHLRDKGISVRIRELSGDKYEFTVKAPIKETSEYTHLKKEYTLDLESKT